jgi:ATP adenylyltransferase
MNFSGLKTFLKSKMKLSHVYQPLLIKELIENGGKCTTRQLAVFMLKYDESQIRYFENRLKDMPIKILQKHKIINFKNDVVELDINNLSFEQKAEIRKICEDKLFELISKRGISLWDYRFLDSDFVPDSLRYRVLKESDGKCALCGATKRMRPLEVDHIIPRSKGGKTEYDNLQVLCTKCNRTKNNKDDTDFRENNEEN